MSVNLVTAAATATGSLQGTDLNYRLARQLGPDWSYCCDHRPGHMCTDMAYDLILAKLWLTCHLGPIWVPHAQFGKQENKISFECNLYSCLVKFHLSLIFEKKNKR